MPWNPGYNPYQYNQQIMQQWQPPQANPWQQWQPPQQLNAYSVAPQQQQGWYTPTPTPLPTPGTSTSAGQSTTAPNLPTFNMPTWWSTSGAPMDWPTINGMGEEDTNQAYGYFQNVRLPMTQLAMNQQQWGDEFNEGNRRWQTQNDWTQGTDQFAMNMANRQQGWTEAWEPKRQENELRARGEEAALGAWGRRMRPSARYL